MLLKERSNIEIKKNNRMAQMGFEDPLGYVNGANTYQLELSDPVNNLDPTGMVVDITVNYGTGTLVAVDRTTRQTLTLTGVFSGDGKDKNQQSAECNPGTGPIPVGTYFVHTPEDHRGRPASHSTGHTKGNYVWYPLRWVGPDGKPHTTHSVTGPDGKQHERSGLFLHVGSVSDGCVTVPATQNPTNPDGSPNPDYPNSSDWDKLRQMLDATTPGTDTNYIGQVTVVPPTVPAPTPPTTQPAH